MVLIKSSSKITDLSNFLRMELFDNWVTDRKPLEIKWQENEDAFDGISNGTWKAEEGEDWRSNTFIMATKIKGLTAYSMVIDIALEGGRLPFNLDLSPWDDINLEDMPQEQQDITNDALGDMNGLIHQQIIDCSGIYETMKCIMGAAKLGETYWMSFVHDVKRKGFKAVNLAEQGGVLNPGMAQKYQGWEYFEQIIKSPGFRYVSAWDTFRDLETDDLQESRGYCHRVPVSAYDLRQILKNDLKGTGYIPQNIEDAIESYSYSDTPESKKNEEKPGLRRLNNRYNNMERLNFFCRVPRETLTQFQYDTTGEALPDNYEGEEVIGDEVEVMASLVGDSVIRCVPIETGSRQHGRIVWEMKLDGIEGIGVADNMKSVKLPLNGVFRSFEDNKKLSANVMGAGKPDKIENWDGKFKPGGFITLTDETKSVNEAWQQIVIQDVGESLLSAIAVLERYADEISMLPKILQGAVLDKQKPDTLGELNMLQSNAGKYIGSVFKNFDNQMFEPITWRFYHYNMMDQTLNKGKGNYIAAPKGYEMFREKVIRLSKILQAIQLLTVNQAVAGDVKFKSLYNQVLDSLEVDPDTVWKTPDEKQKDFELSQKMEQMQLEKAVQMMGIKMSAELKAEIAKIEAQHQAKLAEMEKSHRDKMAEQEAQARDKIINKRK